MLVEERNLLCELLRRHCGLTFSGPRERSLTAAVAARMQELGIPGIAEYLVLLQAIPAETINLATLVTNHETYFFRHQPSFAALRGIILPTLTEEGIGVHEPLRLWSCACSIGSEVWSLAITCREFGITDFQILGTDLSPAVVRQARSACFQMHELRGLSPTHRKRYFRRGDDHGKNWEVCSELRERGRFATYNLIGPEAFPLPPQHVIFCQNVLIYFRDEDRIAVLNRLSSALAPGGYLVPGPTDALGIRPNGLTTVTAADALVFRRPG